MNRLMKQLTMTLMAGMICGSASAATYELSTNYADGTSFTGKVTFNANETAVLGVNGVLTGYSPTLGHTGNPADVTDINTYLGPCSNVYTTYCFNGGVWINPGDVAGFAFNYAAALGAPAYAGGYDGDIHGYFSAVSTGAFSVIPAPEPRTWALMLLGFLGLGAALRRAKLGKTERSCAMA